VKLWIIAGLGFCLALFSGLQMQKNQHGVDDFDQFYVGARLVFGGHLYDPAAQLELQRETVGVARAEVSSSRLPFYYAMLWPLGKLPYGTARAVWFGLMILCGVGFVWIYPFGKEGLHPAVAGGAVTSDTRRSVLAAAVLCSLPLFAATLGQRQDLALVLLIIAIGLWLRGRGMEGAGGFVWALLAIKIHLFLLVPVALVMRREWRMLFGLASGGVVLVGISFWAAGAGWVRQYVGLISDPGVISYPAGKPNLHGVLAGVAHAGWWEVVLGLAVVLGVVVVGRRNSFELAFSGALLGSFLVSNHAYLHDCAVLIPGLVEIVSRVKRQPARPAVVRGAEMVRGGRNGWGILAWGLAITLLTPFPYFLPPLLVHIREGVVPAVLIGCTLLALAAKGESKA
jgi:hypothetical protein